MTILSRRELILSAASMLFAGPSVAACLTSPVTKCIVVEKDGALEEALRASRRVVFEQFESGAYIIKVDGWHIPLHSSLGFEVSVNGALVKTSYSVFMVKEGDVVEISVIVLKQRQT